MARDDAPDKNPATEKGPPSTPDRYIDDVGRYMVKWPADNIKFIVERVHRKGWGELWGLVTVQIKRGDRTETLIRQARINFRSLSTPDIFRRRIEAIIGKYQWDVRLIQTGDAILQLEGETDPFIDSATIPKPNGTVYLAHPFIERGRPTILFGQYGSLKSLFATALAFQAIGLPILPDVTFTEPIDVLFLDWEADEETFSQRRDLFLAACDGVKPVRKIFYRHLTLPFVEIADEVREFVIKEKIGLTIGDSVVMASGGLVREEEAAVSLYSASRPLGSMLWISHMRQDDEQHDRPRALGVGVWMSQARQGWLTEKQQVEGDSSATLSLYHAKYNNDGWQRPRAYRIDFSNGSIAFRRTDARDTESHDRRASLHARVEALLAAEGMMTSREIEEALGSGGKRVTKQLIDNNLRRGRGTTFVREGGSPPYRWGLLARDMFSEESAASTDEPEEGPQPW